MTHEIYHPGLRGVIAGETEICCLDGGVQYRGYCLHELAEGATFLEVVYLLLFDELPSEEQFADFLGVLHDEQQLPEIIHEVFDRLPVHVTPLEVLRTAIGLLSHFDPQSAEPLLATGHSQTIRMLSRLPLIIGAWHRSRLGQSALQPRQELSFIGNLYYLLTGQTPTVLVERALDIALMVCAEHEFNPSSYVARIVSSTRTNQYGPVLAALESFIGTSHGGGDDHPLDVLDAVGTPDAVDSWLESLRPDEIPPGFGHPVYKDYDPRATILEAECERIAVAHGRTDLEQLADAIERGVWTHFKVPPNIDWPLARLFSYLGFERDLFRSIFAVARIIGWSAHAVEQCESQEVIRPRARYRGATDRTFEPLRIRTD